MSSPRAEIDWVALRPHYEAGILPLKAIGREFGCSDAAIIKHAGKHKWARNLKGKIQAAADAKVSVAAVSEQVSARGKVAEAVVVEVNATLQASVRLMHRTLIGKGRVTVEALFTRLEDQLAGGDDEGLKVALELPGMGPEVKELLERARSALAKARALPVHASTVKSLAESLRVLVGLERQAYGIQVDDGGGEDDQGFREAMLHARARALKR